MTETNSAEIGPPYVSSDKPIAETPDGKLKVYQSSTTPPYYDIVVDGVLKHSRLDDDEAIRYLVRINNASALQAQLDAVMLEHCPDEMSEEQKKRWADNQVPVKFGCHCDIETMDEDFVPDNCVLDEHMDQNCIYAPPLRAAGKTKHACSYWQPIHMTPRMAALLNKS